jgi:hypothetical protein
LGVADAEPRTPGDGPGIDHGGGAACAHFPKADPFRKPCASAPPPPAVARPPATASSTRHSVWLSGLNGGSQTRSPMSSVLTTTTGMPSSQTDRPRPTHCRSSPQTSCRCAAGGRGPG